MSTDTERERLRAAFAREADTFPTTGLTVYYLQHKQPFLDPALVRKPNHMVMLWQYYGALTDASQFIADLKRSNISLLGVAGSELSCYAIIEGEGTELFLRMATRAGATFSEDESRRLSGKTRSNVDSNLRQSHPDAVLTFIENNHPLGRWLNFVLSRVPATHPVYALVSKLHLDPFTASLNALEFLIERGVDASMNSHVTSPSALSTRRFKVALSFAGEQRDYVAAVADGLLGKVGPDSVFYDRLYEPHLARPNLDVLLQRIYLEQSDLVVVFLGADYERKEWCGLEWRAIREIIKKRRDESIMLVRFDTVDIPGVFGIDGYLDAGRYSPSQTVDAIIARLAH